MISSEIAIYLHSYPRAPHPPMRPSQIMDNIETTEYSAIKELLRDIVRSNLMTLIDDLFNKELITEGQEAELRNDQNSTTKRADDLISMVMNKVKRDPTYFTVFIDVLKRIGVPSIDEIISQLGIEPKPIVQTTTSSANTSPVHNVSATIAII